MPDSKTSAASYAAASSAVFFGLTANELAAYVGMVLAIATFAINWYYKREHLKIIEEKVNRMPNPSFDSEDV